MTGKQFDTTLKELGLTTRAAAAAAFGLSPRSITTFATAKSKRVPRWLELATKGLQAERKRGLTNSATISIFLLGGGAF